MGILPDYMFGGKGLLIEGVSAGGPADQAGLKKGDVIIEIAGKAVPNVNGYMAVLQTQKSGATVAVKILRDSKEMQLKVPPK
jgi:S1-C subfamily serine protease